MRKKILPIVTSVSLALTLMSGNTSVLLAEEYMEGAVTKSVENSENIQNEDFPEQDTDKEDDRTFEANGSEENISDIDVLEVDDFEENTSDINRPSEDSFNENISFDEEELVFEHEYDEGFTILEPSCTLEGTKAYTCIYCDDVIYETIPFLDHVPMEKVMENYEEALPNKKGSYDEVVYCEVCGAELKRTTEEIEKTQLETPYIESIENALDGVQISWDEIEGADTYRVFRKGEGSGWKKQADVSSLSYIDYNVKSGKTYAYTIRCMSDDGEYLSNYDKIGARIKYIAAPQLLSVTNVYGGVSFKWKAVSGAKKYVVFRRSGTGSWKRMATTKSQEYVDKSVKSGSTYTYTVRCVDEYGNYTSAYNKTGRKIKYIAAVNYPTVTQTSNGLKIVWKKINGAEKYRVFRKIGDGAWKKLADTKSLSYIDKNVSNGNVYTYTVRCISTDGKKYTSASNNGGTTYVYLLPISITNLTSPNSSSIRVEWNQISSMTGYEIRYGNYSSEKIVKTGNSTVTIEGLTSGTAYAVAIRAYKTTGGTTYYSDWSQEKSVTVKAAAPIVPVMPTYVWLSATGSKYHRIPNCGRMNPNRARQVTLAYAQAYYGRCSKCF